MLVAVDLGNTRIKLAAFEGDRIVARETIEGGSLDGSGATLAAGVIPFAPAAAADEVVVVSSAPDATAALIAALDRPVRVLGDDVRGQLVLSYERPEELGMDRLAAAFGARELVGGGSVVAVDAGTAVTVDAIDASGRFVAVAIAPGLATASLGLRRTAPHLPPARTRGAVTVPATSTEESLRNGVLLGWAGLVSRIAAAAQSAVQRAAPIVVTGGDAPRLAPILGPGFRHEPDAVLYGIRALHRLVPA